MDRLHIGDLGGGDYAGDVQIALTPRRRSYADSLVGLAHRKRVAVSLGEDQHRADAQLLASPDYAQGYLSPIGDEDFIEHNLGLGEESSSTDKIIGYLDLSVKGKLEGYFILLMEDLEAQFIFWILNPIRLKKV